MYNTFYGCYSEVLNRARQINNDPDYLQLSKSLVNETHKTALGKHPWPFLSKSGSILTTPFYSTGTISWTQGNATINGSGTVFTPAMTGWYLQLGSFNDLYRVTYVSATQLQIAPAAAPASAANQGFFLFPVTYALPSDFKLPEELDNFITKPPMGNVGEREFRRLTCYPRFGPPLKWALRWEASALVAPVPLMAIWPFSDVPYVIHFDYTINTPDLVNDPDPILIPDQYTAIVVHGAMEWMYANVLDAPDRALKEMAEKDKLRNQMLQDYGFTDDAPQVVPYNYRKKKACGSRMMTR